MPFMGMRGTGDWPANYVPESWARAIMYENPQGVAPLFAMSSMFGDITVPSTVHHWWTKATPDRATTLAAGSAIYLDSGLSNAYAYSTPGAKGDILYVKVPASFTSHARKGKTVLLQDQSNLRVGVEAKVLSTNTNGANSYLVVELLEADDNATVSSATASLQSVDYVKILSSAHGQGSPAPTSIVYDPTQLDNYTQIFRNTYDQTNTALATELRVGDPLMLARKDCSEQHAQDIEWAGIWGTKLSDGVDENNKPLTKTMGFVPFLREYNAANIIDFVNDSAYTTKTWLEGGSDYLNDSFKTLARYAGGEVMCLCGDDALSGIEKLAMTFGHFNLKNNDTSYGLKFRTWVNSHLTIHFATHPLLSLDASTRSVALLYKPENIRFAALSANGINRATTHQENMQVPGTDGLLNGFITEGMWLFDKPNQFMALFGVGSDGAASGA